MDDLQTQDMDTDWYAHCKDRTPLSYMQRRQNSPINISNKKLCHMLRLRPHLNHLIRRTMHPVVPRGLFQAPNRRRPIPPQPTEL